MNHKQEIILLLNLILIASLFWMLPILSRELNAIYILLVATLVGVSAIIELVVVKRK